MQLLLRTFLAIYLAHLLAEFVLQPHRLIEQKRRGNPAAYLLHGIIHYLSAVFIMGFVVPGSLLSLRTQFVLAALTLVHLLIDFSRTRLARTHMQFAGSWAYASDQLLHTLTVILAAWLLSPAVPLSALGPSLQNFRAIPNRFLAVPVIYVGVTFGGGYLIRFLVRSLAASVDSSLEGTTSEQLQNAGLYIGWLERFMVITALLLQSPATVGMILTAKSIARYPELKSQRFAEYYLIGTLLSISMALLGGAFLAKLIFGQVHVPG